MAPTPESPATDDLVYRITDAVAQSTDTDQLALPPLQRAVDTEALAALVDSDGLSELTFTYHDHVLTIDGDGNIELSKREPKMRHVS